MKRKLVMVVLALGTVGGYGWGLASMGCHRHHAQSRREAFERHVAKVCVEAARGVPASPGRPAQGDQEGGER